jgi:hypothetical protein
MKVLTLWEPWATLLVHGVKKIETRPKPTTWTIEKGTYLIHAAKKWTQRQDNLCTLDFRNDLNKIMDIIKIGHPYWEREFHFGHIIGAVDIIECKKIPKLISDSDNEIYTCLYENFTISWDEFSFGDYREGRYAWICRNQKVLKNPIPYKGGQGYYQNFKGDINQLEFI